nr:MAG TPA: hypothetical protein [Caudoviricetes sp.]
MEYKNNTFVTGSPMIIDRKAYKTVIIHVFFKENRPLIMDQIIEELTAMFKTFNIVVGTQISVSKIVTMINYEVFECGLIIQLDIPENVKINVNTLETIENSIPVIIKLAIDVQKIHDRRDAINKDLKMLKPSTPAKKEKCD